MTGANCDFHRFVECDLGSPLTPDEKVDAGAFIWDGKDLWEASFEDGKEFWKVKLDTKKTYAIGSGSPHAITAMDCGLSAKDAVKMAMKRDSRTGGRIKVYKIKAGSQPGEKV